MAEITSPTIITRINQILDAKVELDDAVQKFNSVSEPSYDDITLLPELWNMFCRYLKLHRHCANPQSVYERKLFIFLILTIYSPRTLAGGKMKLGLRDELGKLFGLNARTPISDNARDVAFLYRTDRIFKRDATRLMKMAYKYFSLNQLAEDFNLLTDPDETDIDLLLERVMGNKSAL